MNHSLKTRVISMILAVMMIVGMLPMTATATETAQKTVSDFDTTVSNGYYNVISSDIYNLAPGAVEKEIILNNADGTDRKVVHVFEVDTANDQIEVVPGYYGIDKLNPDDLAGDSAIWKAEQLTKTVTYYEDTLGYNVVGAMNTALAYDSNAPYGYMVWNGVVLGTPEVHKGAQTYLAIYPDGTAELRSMSTPLDGNEWTAISANFGWLVKDGAMTSTSVERTSSDASRSMIGIKADGTLVFCQVDGRNAPTSTGLSNYEMGEMMLSLGCVNAVNCDGGGSSTFVSKREGTTENVMRSVPSDGSERPTINSVMIVSKATATGIFDHAVVEADYGYIAPGASVTVTVTGVDAGGYPAEVPADVSWQLNDESMGFIEDGVFTAGETVGDVTVQLVCNEAVVGELLVHIVHPDTFGFTSDSTVVPYGKSAELEIAASYGADSWGVCIDGAYELTLSDADAAVLEGDVLIAPTDESITGVDVTATYIPDATKTDVIAVTFGKGSEILFDFEDGSVDGWMGFVDAKQWSIDNGVNNTLVGSDPIGGQFNEQISSTTFLSSADMGGKVKNGEYALAWSLDNTDAGFAGWSYNILFYVGEQIVLRDVANGKNATKLGMWLYIPENAPGLAFQSQLYTAEASCKQAHFTFTTADGSVKNLNSCTEADIPESRWVYASIDLTAYDYIATPDPYNETNSRSPSIARTYVKPTEPAVITFYIDDITLDYSSAVDDRILPTISDVSYTTADESVTLEDGAEISGTSVAFSAKVADNAGLNNATGVILIDGVAMNSNVSGGVLSCDNVALNPGIHRVSFEIQDKLGNLAKVTRTITISGDAVVTLSGHNDSGAAAEYDSVYYADINVADITAIDTLTTTIYLQTANTWEPEGISVAEGFEAEYSLNEITNELTVTVKRVGDTTLTGAQTLVSLPVRVWSWDGVNNVTGEAITPETQFATGYCPIVQIRCDVVYGEVTFTDNGTAPFGGAMTVETNLNDNVNPWHYHDSELTILNKEATCTTAGYENRTYCETCQSVVDWGTEILATGHSYEDVDGVLTCICSKLFNGELDGKFYADGVVANGWVNNSYYVDGVKLTGIQVIDGYYYDFGEDGICEDQAKLTGLFQMDGKTYYAISGNLMKGWHLIVDSWYHFNVSSHNGFHGTYSQAYFGLTDPLEYTFVDGKLISGVWVSLDSGIRYYYGPSYYTNCWQTIDGDKYYFDAKGYVCTGYCAITANKNDPTADYQMYYFDETGKLVETLTSTGMLDTGEAVYYLENGMVAKIGLVKVDGNYYYFSTTSGVMYKSGTRFIAPDCISESASDIPAGTYTFGADGKMVVQTPDEEPEEESKNGIVGDYYYVDGIIQKVGLIKIDGAYYYFSTTNGKMYKNGTRYVAQDCITHESVLGMKAGTYTFGADGKMVIEVEEGKEGIVGDYYYVDGVIQKVGLIKIDGAYYYFSTTNGKMYKNGTRYVAQDCITHESVQGMKAGTYTFGADGKMIVG